MKKIMMVALMFTLVFTSFGGTSLSAQSVPVGGHAGWWVVYWSKVVKPYDCGTSTYVNWEATMSGVFREHPTYDEIDAKATNNACEYNAKHEKRTFRAESKNGAGIVKKGPFRRWGNDSTANQGARRGNDYFGGQQGTWG